MAKAKPIHLSVDSNGNMTYDPSVLRTRREEQIVWRARVPFTVVFARGSPLAGRETEIHNELVDGEELVSKARAIAPEAELGSYKYQTAIVFMEHGKVEKVFLDANCGEVLIGK